MKSILKNSLDIKVKIIKKVKGGGLYSDNNSSSTVTVALVFSIDNIAVMLVEYSLITNNREWQTGIKSIDSIVFTGVSVKRKKFKRLLFLSILSYSVEIIKFRNSTTEHIFPKNTNCII